MVKYLAFFNVHFWNIAINSLYIFQVYSVIGRRFYLDFAYEISINTLENFEEMSCDPYMNIHFDDALYKAANNKLEDRFRCTVPFLPPLISNNTGSVTEVCKDPIIGKAALEMYDYFKSGGLSLISKQPCASMDIFLGLPFTSDHIDNEAYLKIYLKTSVKVKNTVWDYDYLSAIGEFGGYTGLLLGISLLDILFKAKKLVIRIIMEKFSTRMK